MSYQMNVSNQHTQSLMFQSNQIINACQRDMKSTERERRSNNQKSLSATHNSQNLPKYVLDCTKLNPHDQAETEQYVMRLRSKRKKFEKHNFIRKSELGDSQFTFTKAEEMKLEIIDQFIERGYEIPDPFSIELQPSFPQQAQMCLDKQSEAKKEKSGKQGSPENQKGENDQKILKELNNFYHWGENGNKESIIQISEEHVKQCIEKMKFPKQRKKQNKKNQVKLLDFQKIPRKSKERSKKHKFSQISHEVKPYMGSSHANKFKLMAPKILSQFQPQQYLQYVHEKFPPIKQLRSNNISVKQMNTLKRKEKLHQVSEYIFSKYFGNKPDSIYMTNERFQALYECEMIKGAKQIMDHKEYVNLQLKLNPTQSKQEETNENQCDFEKEKHISGNSKQSLGDTIRSDQFKCVQPKPKRKMEQIDKILQKNWKRIKVERQRVIEKLRC